MITLSKKDIIDVQFLNKRIKNIQKRIEFLESPEAAGEIPIEKRLRMSSYLKDKLRAKEKQAHDLKSRIKNGQPC